MSITKLPKKQRQENLLKKNKMNSQRMVQLPKLKTSALSNIKNKHMRAMMLITTQLQKKTTQKHTSTELCRASVKINLKNMDFSLLSNGTEKTVTTSCLLKCKNLLTKMKPQKEKTLPCNRYVGVTYSRNNSRHLCTGSYQFQSSSSTRCFIFSPHQQFNQSDSVSKQMKQGWFAMELLIVCW